MKSLLDEREYIKLVQYGVNQRYRPYNRHRWLLRIYPFATEILWKLDAMRNAALGKSETYRTECVSNVDFDVITQAGKLADSMPVYNNNIARSLAQKKEGAAQHSSSNSILAKLLDEEDTKTYESILQFAKGKKRRRLYRKNCAYANIR